jgi:hypothetical protein
MQSATLHAAGPACLLQVLQQRASFQYGRHASSIHPTSQNYIWAAAKAAASCCSPGSEGCWAIAILHKDILAICQQLVDDHVSIQHLALLVQHSLRYVAAVHITCSNRGFAL